MNSNGLSKALWTKTYVTTFTALATLVLAAGCGSDGAGGGGKESASSGDVMHGTIGPNGGELVGQVGSALEGVIVNIPAGALSAETEIEVRPTSVSGSTPLPKTAVECGPEFAISPAGLALAKPATVTLPFDEQTVTDNYRFDDEVKAWLLPGAAKAWTQRPQNDSGEGTVAVDVDTFGTISAGVNPPADEDLVKFDLHPNPKFVGCLGAYPDDPKKQPTASVVVVRGSQNDGLFISAKNIKPGLQFDMFTTEDTQLDANGKLDGTKNFGLAWYQSDLEAGKDGRIRGNIRTILLDQIFGFDPRASLAPTQTFHLGFWFNNPADVSTCGFTGTTPFNGEHNAGPMAMITEPDATTQLGPLCTKPDTSTTPAHCDP